jgi:GNAT superfamily N-acetyltransferase
MNELAVTTASRADEAAVIGTLELAFAADPVMRWFWPDPSVYRASFPRFAAAIAGQAFDHESAHVVDGGRAIALWLPPGVGVDEDAMVTVLLESVDPAILEDLTAFGELIGEHHPQDDYWYLPITGVDPLVQGQGRGSSLLRHALAVADRDGLPAYLEASTSRSRALYESVGFEVVSSIQAGSSPTVWAMLRAPQGVSRGQASS